MQIVLHPLKTISEVEAEFRTVYPYLKIIFFPGNKGTADDILVADLSLGTLCRQWKEKQLLIHPFHSVKEVELIFSQHLQIPVQVVRQQKEIWVDTCGSYYLSLDTQNEMGRLET
ncbi:MAG: hypothetical protein ACXWB9_03540 [Flavisolibacter sp.]